ncbi:MAG: BamA/TamA family outer membrane protein, partial [Ignavibacteriales bacterium]|nr:BamA/TamA family outer membrane protein [Ignavibacteriales bacterium]
MNLTLQSLYHPDSTFDDLKIPFRAIAVDLIKGKRTIIDRGSLAEAMRSSITVPLLYTPLERDSMALVDGGLVSNIPVDVAVSAGCDFIIAVNSTSGLRSASQMTAPWEVADQIMTIIMQAPNEKQMEMADVVVTPQLGERLVSDFSGIDSLIAAGERETEKIVSNILQAFALKEETNHATSDSILSNVEIKIQGKFVADDIKRQLQSDVDGGKISVQKIEQRLHELSESGNYEDVHAEVSSLDGTTKVTYHLQPQPIIQRVEFSGNSVISSEDIRSVVSELESNVLNFYAIQHVLENVLLLYRQRNYSLARITNVEVEPKDGTVQFTMNEGILQDVLCEGNVRAQDYIIRREFPWNYGDVFNIQKANAGLINIASTGLYEYILMDVRYRDEQPKIIIKVKERSAELVRFGFHANNEHGILGTVELRDANFRGAGEDLSLLLRYGFRDRLARAEYRANRIFNTYLTFNFKGYVASRDVFTYKDDQTGSVARWERSEDGRFREIKIGGSFTFGSQLARLGDLTAELRTEQQRISGISGTGYNEEDHRIVGLKLQTTLDTENKFVFSTEGILLTLSYETALKSLGSEVSFTKINASWSAYHTFFNKHTIHPHIRVGFADETLPLSEQFSLGGLQTFFGMQEDDRRGRQVFVG